MCNTCKNDYSSLSVLICDQGPTCNLDQRLSLLFHVVYYPIDLRREHPSTSLDELTTPFLKAAIDLSHYIRGYIFLKNS